MNEKEFITELKKLGVMITDKQLGQLNTYFNLLSKWNNKTNLTTIIEKEEVYLKHFYDSLTIIKVIDLSKYNTLCDFGSGAGFPGLVIKILFPHLKVELIEAKQKKVDFLKVVIEQLQLTEIKASHLRVEDLPKQEFDIITCRAVASLNNIIKYTNHLITNQTNLVVYKSHVETELEEAQKELKKRNLSILKNIQFFLPKEGSTRTLLLVKKR